MTPYIEAKKAEVREKFRAIGEGSVRFISTREEVLEFFNGEIDTLLDEIQEAVVPKKQIEFVGDVFAAMGLPSGQQSVEEMLGIDKARAFNKCRAETLEAFQHLRTGVETE